MKTLFLFSLLFVCMFASAQDDTYYALTKSDATVQYTYKYGDKLMGYLVNHVNENKVEGNITTITTLLTMLNKKEKPSKSASLMGLGEGMLSSIKIENGTYYMTQDLAIACGGENRQGFILKIPASLKVGDEIEGGTLNFGIKFMGVTSKNQIVYKNFKVIGEVDLNTSAGTFHCLKITGTVTGKYQRMDINDNQVWYVAKGVGIVREELYYMGTPLILEAYKTNGL